MRFRRLPRPPYPPYPPQVVGSAPLYQSLLGLCRSIFAEEGTASFCALRSQLPLALQDRAADSGTPAELRERAGALLGEDKCSKITTVLEECLKVRARAERSERRLDLQRKNGRLLYMTQRRPALCLAV